MTSSVSKYVVNVCNDVNAEDDAEDNADEGINSFDDEDSGPNPFDDEDDAEVNAVNVDDIDNGPDSFFFPLTFFVCFPSFFPAADAEDEEDDEDAEDEEEDEDGVGNSPNFTLLAIV